MYRRRTAAVALFALSALVAACSGRSTSRVVTSPTTGPAGAVAGGSGGSVPGATSGARAGVTRSGTASSTTIATNPSQPPVTAATLTLATHALPITYQGATRPTQGRWVTETIGGRSALVWLPAEYPAEPSTDTSRPGFPVVYLLHGVPGIYGDWARGAWADVQADALLAAGRIGPVILVLPDLYGGYANERPDPGCASTAETYLVDVVVPFVDLNFHTTGARAVGGLSDGGGCAVVWATRHPELFRAAFALAGYWPAMPTPGTGVQVFLETGALDTGSRAESERAAAVLGAPLHLMAGHDHAWSTWAQDLGMTLPWALGVTGNPWPPRRATPADPVVLGAPVPLPDALARVGAAPRQVRLV